MVSLRGVSILCLLVPCAAPALPAESAQRLRSPDGRIELVVRTEERIAWDVLLDGRALLQGSTLSLDVDRTVLGHRPKLKASKRRSVAQDLEPAVRQKAAKLREAYNELRLDFAGGYAVAFRAYDEGVAYRLETSLPRPQVKVYAEEVDLRFAGDYKAYYPQEESLFSHQERHFPLLALKEVPATAFATLPAVVDVPGGPKVAVAESDVEDYPALWLKGTGENRLTGMFAPYPLEEKLERDRDLKVVRAADYIAVTKGTRTYPWRVLGIARKDGDLFTSSLVWLLAKPSQVADTSWIRPGKVAWDWYNANNLFGVDFKAGIDTATYKYFIDFASRYGIEYVILDEGWYVLGDVLKIAPGMDVEELASYAKQKNVGLILWVIWNTFDKQLEPALALWETWGVKGIKVDFMQRDDQPIMNYYHRISREAAKHKMLVDFHGAQRPASLTRTWPNLITAEGVRGLEWNKWSADAHPEHNVTLPFTRMFLGPLDYTPGAMRNAGKAANFVKVFERPMSLGTRCHQLAMYVVFESPLQMLADTPSHYLREPEAMEFLGPVPSVWDETRVLDARMADYVLVARRKGADWWLGAMTDWTPRDLDLDLSFLPEGAFEMDAYQDGPNADRYGEDYKRVKTRVDRATKIKLPLAGGGGWAARIRLQ
jgi:alpha-glucosidase